MTTVIQPRDGTQKGLPRRPFVLAVRVAVKISLALALTLLGPRQPAVRAPLNYVEAGMVAPDFSLSSAQGDIYHLADLHGQVVLLSFVNTQPLDASLSTPDASRSQIVFLKSIAQQYTANGVQVLLVDATALVQGKQPDQSELLNFVHNWDMETVPMLMESEAVAQAYGVSEVPSTFVITPDGWVTQRWEGVTTVGDLALTVQSLAGWPGADTGTALISHTVREGKNQ